MTELKNKAGVPIRVEQVWKGIEANYEVLCFKGERIIVWSSKSKQPLVTHDTDTSCFIKLISDPIWGDMSQHVIVTDEQKRLYKKPNCAEFWNGCVWVSVNPRAQWDDPSYHTVYYRIPADFTAWEPVEESPGKTDHTGAPLRDDANATMDSGHAKGDDWQGRISEREDGFWFVYANDADEVFITKHLQGEIEQEPVEPEKPKYKLFKLEWKAAMLPFIDGIGTYDKVQVGFYVLGYRIFGYTDNETWCESAAVLVNPDYFTESCNHAGNRKYAIGYLESQQ